MGGAPSPRPGAAERAATMPLGPVTAFEPTLAGRLGDPGLVVDFSFSFVVLVFRRFRPLGAPHKIIGDVKLPLGKQIRDPG